MAATTTGDGGEVCFEQHHVPEDRSPRAVPSAGGPGPAAARKKKPKRGHLIRNDVFRRGWAVGKGGAVIAAVRAVLATHGVAEADVFPLAPEVGSSGSGGGGVALDAYPDRLSWVGEHGGVLVGRTHPRVEEEGSVPRVDEEALLPTAAKAEYTVDFGQLRLQCERAELEFCVVLLEECEKHLSELSRTIFVDPNSRFLLATMLRKRRDTTGILRLMREDFPDVWGFMEEAEGARHQGPGQGPVVHWDGSLVAFNVELVDSYSVGLADGDRSRCS